MKRKADSPDVSSSAKKQKTIKDDVGVDDVKSRFRAGLFEKSVLASYTKEYAASSPYKHAVIHDLVDDALLRSVRDEIRANVQFAPKETDIYKIHQSGDLANLDGLDDESMAKLPSLRALRDAVYSDAFRSYVSAITGCGPLSGRKTDMAINVYTPGCYLLCHDDVIGSRRVSYILYLTDPDRPWRPEWGGALRLYPVEELRGKDGQVAKTPLPDPVKVIPPAWNQLSFFAVQPGESFHDVEEVFHAESGRDDDGGRVRMAISGWFHIPQPGEQGYVDGEEERNAENSSLMQLQGDPAQYDVPCARPLVIDGPSATQDGFDEADLEFLLKYMAPTYLTPDTLEQISDHFSETSSISLANVLSNKFARRLKQYLEAQENLPTPRTSADVESKSPWRVAKPPHKHRYLFQQPSGPDQLRTSQEESPVTELLDIFLPSRHFRRWLQMATDCVIESCDLTARRFRRGQDYTLATGHDGRPRLELNLGITPTSGWGEDEENDDEEARVQDKSKGKAKAKAEKDTEGEADHDVGGHEVYMAGDDGEEGDDAAVYKSSGDDENMLFFQAAAWNKLTLVLRDSGTLRFVKYVSSRAPGDRWDVSGVFGIEDEDAAAEPGGESDEEEFNGFSDPVSIESDSD
ncbi:Prolyl 3,4-dihydroxylase ofd1 [Ophiocordyceps camponoti-floridani]|uniref:uS12 prolyl 3,4-dihydroxylase n=1 Tax=Ophiocordyceps camponoti-floridani TaxID=2030778 RepID=A0A8H4Q0T9_9HYPO|nr:Prolyl 3,4-dihydroxylase ofd1 [Ophiocordyceps camponoti-floridani]